MQSPSADTALKLEEFILAELAIGTGRTTLARDEDLLEADLLDSAGIAELVSFLESEFAVTVADDELQPDNFRSIDAIAAFVDRKRSAAR